MSHIKHTPASRERSRQNLKESPVGAEYANPTMPAAGERLPTSDVAHRKAGADRNTAPPPVARFDADVRADIRSLLDAEIEFDASAITVEVDNGSVHLVGKVRGIDAVELVENLASVVPGVRSVSSDLRVV